LECPKSLKSDSSFEAVKKTAFFAKLCPGCGSRGAPYLSAHFAPDVGFHCGVLTAFDRSLEAYG
jgi:hypothetical protein